MSQTMPALFVGHGNPMNALLDSSYTQGWAELGIAMPRPKAILSVSAHWYIEDAAVTVSTAPRIIHDFGGFPRELYEGQYPAPAIPTLLLASRSFLHRCRSGARSDGGSTTAPGRCCAESTQRRTFSGATKH